MLCISAQRGLFLLITCTWVTNWINLPVLRLPRSAIPYTSVKECCASLQNRYFGGCLRLFLWRCRSLFAEMKNSYHEVQFPTLRLRNAVHLRTKSPVITCTSVTTRDCGRTLRRVPISVFKSLIFVFCWRFTQCDMIHRNMIWFIVQMWHDACHTVPMMSGFKSLIFILCDMTRSSSSNATLLMQMCHDACKCDMTHANVTGHIMWHDDARHGVCASLWNHACSQCW